MKYGFEYNGHLMLTSALFYALQDCTVVSTNNTITFTYDGDEYLFSRFRDDILKCDKKIKLTQTDIPTDYNNEYDLIIFVTAEPIYAVDITLLKFLKDGNLCISSGNVLFEHDNFIFDFTFNLIYFYYFHGYHFLNIHKFKEKTNLLGLYYNKKHINSNSIEYRDIIYNNLTEILNEDLNVYPIYSNNITPILNSYRNFGLWEYNHISSYTDFVTSACCVIFETADSHPEEIRRENMTEKTLKGIIFSEANVFTIWYGTRTQYKYLIDKGFWFLNFEFYDESDLKNRMINSISQSALFLKNLKKELGSNEKVHERLLQLYGNKLEKNITIFKNLLNNCELKNEILNKIKERCK